MHDKDKAGEEGQDCIDYYAVRSKKTGQFVRSDELVNNPDETEEVRVIRSKPRRE